MIQNKLLPLNKLKIGECGIVKDISLPKNEIRRRLLDMGITIGSKIKIKLKSPLGDPFCCEIKDYELCLRKSILKMIYVQVMK